MASEGTQEFQEFLGRHTHLLHGAIEATRQSGWAMRFPVPVRCPAKSGFGDRRACPP